MKFRFQVADAVYIEDSEELRRYMQAEVPPLKRGDLLRSIENGAMFVLKEELPIHTIDMEVAGLMDHIPDPEFVIQRVPDLREFVVCSTYFTPTLGTLDELLKKYTVKHGIGFASVRH